MLAYLSLDIICSFPRATLSENCSLLGTDNVRGQIFEHIFAPNGGYCLYIFKMAATVNWNQKTKSRLPNIAFSISQSKPAYDGVVLAMHSPSFSLKDQAHPLFSICFWHFFFVFKRSRILANALTSVYIKSFRQTLSFYANVYIGDPGAV